MTHDVDATGSTAVRNTSVGNTAPSSEAEEIVALLTTQPFPVDPYPLYHRLRSIAPVHRSERTGMTYVSTYEGCATILRSPAFGQGEGARLVRLDPRFEHSAVLQSLGRMLTFIDPPDHSRLRRLVSRVFNPRVIEQLRGYVHQVVDELLEPVTEAGEGDLVVEFGELIPVTVVCELLGVPHDDHGQCRSWTEDIALAIEPVIPDEHMARADRAQIAYDAYFRALVAERRAQPRDDLLSLLAEVGEDGDLLSDDELVSMATLLIGAGSETTRNLIGSGLLGLLRHPDELAQLRTDPTLDRHAVEEMLRHEAPVQTAVPRFALRDIEIEGTLITEGSMVGAMIGAANHDPSRFTDPDHLDLDRPDNLPLTFAPGIHHCLGAAVARLEAEIAVTTVVRRFPDLELLDDQPAMRPSCPLGPNPRGPRNLLVRLGRPV